MDDMDGYGYVMNGIWMMMSIDEYRYDGWIWMIWIDMNDMDGYGWWILDMMDMC